MRRLALSASLLCAAACTGAASPSGLDEPLRVAGATLEHGDLPGREPSDAGAGRAPFVTSIQTSNTVVHAGLSGKQLSGRVSDDAYSIAMRFQDVGSGYWVKPVSVPDVGFAGELTWSATLDFASDLLPGPHVLELVAIDGKGRAGTRTEFPLCVAAPFDHTLNACDPHVPPPAAVISLTWDTGADLDLILRTPSGKIVDAEHPATVDPDGTDAIDLDAPGVGVLSADSNPNCAGDAARREDVIWKTSPAKGTYLVYVDVFNACGKPAAQFEVTAYARTRGQKPGTYRLAQVGPATAGEVLGATANGGATKGLYVTAVEFP